KNQRRNGSWVHEPDAHAHIHVHRSNTHSISRYSIHHRRRWQDSQSNTDLCLWVLLQLLLQLLLLLEQEMLLLYADLLQLLQLLLLLKGHVWDHSRSVGSRVGAQIGAWGG